MSQSVLKAPITHRKCKLAAENFGPCSQSPACPAEQRPAPCTGAPPVPAALVCLSQTRKALNVTTEMNKRGCYYTTCLLWTSTCREMKRPLSCSICSSSISFSRLSFSFSTSSLRLSSCSASSISSILLIFPPSFSLVWSTSFCFSTW